MPIYQELGLVAGIPVGTSLIDAHAGGIGVMESVPVSGSEAEGHYEILCFILLSLFYDLFPLFSLILSVL